ncbi:methionine/alanine import family NSS transporter small subunit [Rothia nasimurium]|uniref:methionine/alanine import family NSS transporter small subunit n=1 Tax=Rothia nasimurium TaxID=85336 RepID=UPI001F1961F6|nr:methionine/alanine import family NSS transporter small subunit [Rothia nasimurium]
MSSIAITMLIVSIALIWGGLGMALIHLSRHPDESGAENDQEPVAPWATEQA